MRKKITIALAAGIATLKDAGLFLDAAQQKLDYNTLLPDLFEPGTTLPLGQVIKAHTKTPEIFPWCND